MKKVFVLFLLFIFALPLFAAISYTGSTFGSADAIFTWDLSDYGSAKLTFNSTSVALTESGSEVLEKKATGDVNFSYEVTAFSAVNIHFEPSGPLSNGSGGQIGWVFSYGDNIATSASYGNNVENTGFDIQTAYSGSGLNTVKDSISLSIETEALKDSFLTGGGTYSANIIVNITGVDS
ncbi:MAG TPA: hypothetical protein IAB12_00965 [Candidatus Ornithospirochaeta avicola]|uniref:WxL domain-containing protein n=1 Tax=Candidatus Ornithospirochaeta avicola TaxID=2840896 RepID=A0A9D1PSC8_9SPIO|nr:hypothetical protein [Candidatus Ornithospirochaeta avicola]